MDRRTWIGAPLAFVSGFCALIYQVVWTRELRLTFGASTAASSAVVAIFVAGLGWGGLWFGRRVERSQRPQVLYAKLELGIALCSAATPWLLHAVRSLYLLSGGSPTLGTFGSTAVRLVLAALVLGPSTWLMGGTLPALARAVEVERDESRRSVAVLYAVNTLGALLGCALSTFVLLEQLGNQLTLYVACALNAAVALAARAVASELEPAPASPSQNAAAVSSDTAQTDEPAAAPAWIVLSSATLVGFAFFLMELVWYRMLGPLLGGTVFTFGLILAVVLAGIGVGSLLYALLQRRATLAAFAITCVLEGVCVALPLAWGDQVAIWAILLRPLGSLGFHGLVAGWVGIALVVVFPAALVAGYQFPLLIALLGRGTRAVGRDVGRAYAANTLGAVLGALAGGFGMLPALGAVGCWRLVALLLAAWGVLAMAVSFLRARTPWRSGWVLALAAATVLMSLSQGPTAAWRHAPIGVGRVPAESVANRAAISAFIAQQRRTVDWQTDGIESAIGIGLFDGLSFIVNGKSDGNARGDAPTQVMGGLVGAALLPRVDKALVIGLGTGSTAGWLGKLPEIERVDVAEIEPAIAHFARRCAAVNLDALDNPKVHIQRGDARELLTVSRERYDLIFSEPSNPYRAGVSNLYTREFYQTIADRLTPNGLFVQWLQAYEIDSQTMRTIYATLSAEFPHVETWNGLHYDLLLVASRKPLVHNLPALRARVASEPFASGARVAWNTEGVEGFLGHFVANNAFTRALAASGTQLNTDDRASVEFGFARAMHDVHSAADSLFLTARARGQQRPQLSTYDIDWSRVDFEREVFAQLFGSSTGIEHLTPMYRSRVDMLRRWLAGDFAGALNIWNTLSSQHGQMEPTHLERLELAEVIAYQGDQTTQSWIAQLTPSQPTLGTALNGVWLAQHGQRQAGLDELARAYEAYRRDPWPLSAVMSRSLNLFQAEKAEPAEVTRWLDALSQPFAVSVNELARAQAQLRIALALGPSNPACVKVLAPLEPEPPRGEEILEFRAACYAEHKSPLHARAAAELERLRAQRPVPFDRLLGAVEMP